jgi:hypothetical protein
MPVRIRTAFSGALGIGLTLTSVRAESLTGSCSVSVSPPRLITSGKVFRAVPV